jgi:thiamine monophosphate synthase
VPADWYSSTDLSWGVRGLLYDICRAGPGRTWTAGQLFQKAARERPGSPDTLAAVAGWLEELTAAGALACHRGQHSIPVNREAALMGAKLGGEHLRLCDPPLLRAEAAQWLTLISELTAHGRHDPADVSLALSRWRERRRAGERLGRGLFLAMLEDLEIAAAEDEPDYVTLCPTCMNAHPATAACLSWGGPR